MSRRIFWRHAANLRYDFKAVFIITRPRRFHLIAKSRIWPFLLATVLAGCATSVSTKASIAPIKHVDLQGSKRGREASETIPQFVGKYRVVDSRGDRRAVDTAEVTLIAGVPTLRLWRSGGTELTVELQANDCSGDLVNKHSQNMFLVCFGTNPHSTRPLYFSISKVTHPELEKSGTLIPRYEPMPVHRGYLIRYQLGPQFESQTALATIREGEVR